MLVMCSGQFMVVHGRRVLVSGEYDLCCVELTRALIADGERRAGGIEPLTRHKATRTAVLSAAAVRLSRMMFSLPFD